MMKISIIVVVLLSCLSLGCSPTRQTVPLSSHRYYLETTEKNLSQSSLPPERWLEIKANQICSDYKVLNSEHILAGRPLRGRVPYLIIECPQEWSCAARGFNREE
jgi:hypothetical protein